ncbi:MAG: cobalamin B12-binding domain-containing protein [Burkholderiales bacterium]
MDQLRGAALGDLSRLMSDRESSEFEPRVGHRARRVEPAPALTDAVSSSEIDHFARLVLRGEMAAVDGFLDALRLRGLSAETIYLGLLESTARRFGEMWLDDSCTFSDVTMGTIRLQQILRALGPWFRGAIECPLPGHRILLVPSPGEQHTFGLFVVADFLARAGWDVWGESGAGDHAMRLVRDEWFDVIGVSVGCVAHLEVLTGHIQRLRSASRNRAVGILVGGPVFARHPEYAASVGADGTAADGSEVAHAAEKLLASSMRPG